MLHRTTRIALGLALVMHGLANTVWPLRGTDASGTGLLLPGVTALYVAAIVGFVAAGLGVFGVRPLRRAVVPVSLAAGVCALGVQFWRADADLWPGVIFSAALPLLATLYAATWPDSGGGRGRPRLVWTTLAYAFLAWVAASALLWPWHRSWGSEPVEWQMALPGDPVPREPALEILHAVTIDAPPEAVWPWLVQIGQDRGGFYSYTWLERAFGAQIRNADTIHPEWQARRVGETVYATQPGYLGGLVGERPGWVIDRLDPGRALVLRHWGAFVLQPHEGGRTRLLVRSTISHGRIPAWLAAVNFTAFELPHFIMQRRMLLGIKARAERSARG